MMRPVTRARRWRGKFTLQMTERTVSTPAHSSRAAVYSARNARSPAPPTGNSASAPTQTAIASSSGRRNWIFGRPCARRAYTRLTRLAQAGAELTSASTRSTSNGGTALPNSERTMTAAVPPSMIPRQT